MYQLREFWPPPVEHISLFVSYMSLEGFSHRTAHLYLSAISFQCKVSHCQDNTKHFLIGKLKEGFKRSGKDKRLRLPITLSLLGGILTMTSAVCRDHYESILFSAAYTLAFFGFFRVGELTIHKQGVVDLKVLSIQDIKPMHEGAILVSIRFSKGDQLGAGTSLKLER